MADLSSFTLLFKSKRFRVGETSGESKRTKQWQHPNMSPKRTLPMKRCRSSSPEVFASSKLTIDNLTKRKLAVNNF